MDGYLTSLRDGSLECTNATIICALFYGSIIRCVNEEQMQLEKGLVYGDIDGCM